MVALSCYLDELIMPLLPCIEKEPQTSANASVIWLHGLGADGNDFAPIIPELKLPLQMAVRFVFPNAPSIPITINGGYVMPAWYDITEMDIERKVDAGQLIESAEKVRLLIDREIDRGIASDRIVLAGFSQGGAVAYQAALTHMYPLAGLMCLSTYFATKDTITPNSANKQIPIKICHGTRDPMVSVQQGKLAHERLVEMGYAVDYSEYPMEHAVCPQEIADISNWLQKVLS
ncbi:MAG: phospholipase/carboxylesterase [Congregibacter sp.]|jgi:phospholipase/carboxylesterase